MSSTQATALQTRAHPQTRSGGALPRVLAGIPAEGAMALSEHLALHGEPPQLRGHGRRRERELSTGLIEQVELAGLLGRGGAAFPTARKLRSVAGARGSAIVVVNGAECEPGSLKDRTLMEALPHLVLDGAQLAAQAVGADELIVTVGETAPAALRSIQAALGERARSRTYAGFDEPAPAVLRPVPTHYVGGQESALVSYLGGGTPRPLFTPPMVFERGVRRRPTLVSNVETFAHLALIARHGARWFRQLGTPAQPGSTLLTLSGPVAYPGVYEIEQGASLSSLIDAAGGLTGGVRAALVGGYAGAWVEGERLGALALSDEHLAVHGARLGAGVVALLSDAACPVAETARVARWMAGQSARQCGPCVHGLDALAGTLERLLAGAHAGQTRARVAQLEQLIQRRGACAHPDGAVNLVMSALEAFPDELAAHAGHGPCERCRHAPELPLPERALPAAAPRKGLYRR